MKGANYQHLTASAYVGLCLCLRASENQPTSLYAYAYAYAYASVASEDRALMIHE